MESNYFFHPIVDSRILHPATPSPFLRLPPALVLQATVDFAHWSQLASYIVKPSATALTFAIMVRPVLLRCHERPLTQIKYNNDGDLLFSVGKDQVVNCFFSHNGERLGTYVGHSGAPWTVDVNSTSTLLATGAADNTIRLWEVRTGKCIKVWEFLTAVKRVEFSEDDAMLLGVTENRMGHAGTVQVFRIDQEDGSKSESEPVMTITERESKATVAGWSYLNKFIIVGHEDGSVSQYNAKSGELLHQVTAHEKGFSVNDIQFSNDRTYFVTACKDKTAKIFDVDSLNVLKTFVANTPLNTAALTPNKDFVIVGGGQAAQEVTTTSARQGRFEARFYHAVFEDEIGRVRGHFGPLNTIAVHPEGTSYASGSEDGYVRVHHFEQSYFDFRYEVEREAERKARQAQMPEAANGIAV